jgi:hypothetical protein
MLTSSAGAHSILIQPHSYSSVLDVITPHDATKPCEGVAIGRSAVRSRVSYNDSNSSESTSDDSLIVIINGVLPSSMCHTPLCEVQKATLKSFCCFINHTYQPSTSTYCKSTTTNMDPRVKTNHARSDVLAGLDKYRVKDETQSLLHIKLEVQIWVINATEDEEIANRTESYTTERRIACIYATDFRYGIIFRIMEMSGKGDVTRSRSLWNVGRDRRDKFKP